MRGIFAFLFLLAASGMASAAAARADPAGAFELRYGMYWGGFHVADVWLSYAPEPEGYRSDLRIETVGLADTLLNYRGTASSAGERTGSNRLSPETYQFRDSSRTTSHAIDMIFDPSTGAAIDVESSKRGTPREVDVPPELWLDVIDPLAAFLQVRRELADLRGGESHRITLPIFDGRRRYDLVAEATGREALSLGGRDRQALRVELAIIPLAGFDREEWEDAGYGDEGMRAEALLSDDDRLIPIQIKTLNTPISLVFNLRRDCQGAACETAASG